MERLSSPSAIVGLTALILVFLTSIPTFSGFFIGQTSKARVNIPNETSKLYEDEDGTATEETQKIYTAALPKYLALSCAMLGLSASISMAVYTTVHPVLNLCFEYWLSVGTWVRIRSSLILIQINASIVMSHCPNHIHCLPA